MTHSWDYVSLGDLTKDRPICYGVLKPGPRQQNGVPLIRVTDVRDNYVNDSDLYQITPELSREFKRSTLNGNEILLSIQGTVGKVAICPKHLQGANVSRTIGVIDPDNRVDRGFLRYWLMSKEGEFPITGMTRASLNISAIRKLRVPLPPLPQQKRIVSILDAALAGIDQAIANAERAIENALELFKSIEATVFRAVDEDWITAPLGKCFRLRSGENLTSKAMVAGSYPVFGGNGVAGTHNESNLQGDNVIVGRVGALCGNARHITSDIWLTDNAFKIVDRAYQFDNHFLTYLLNFMNLRSFARQAAQPVISNSSLKDVVLRFPLNIETQKSIASRLDSASVVVERLQDSWKRKILLLDQLRKTILLQAFDGELSDSPTEQAQQAIA